MPIENSAQLSKKPRVLVVDDSRVMRKAISRVLDAQFDLIETEDGEAGWEALLGDEAIELIISDVEMPRLDGHALLTRIRGSEVARIREIPVIVITGAEDEPAKERAYACGATGFVIKPIDGSKLLSHIRTYLKSDQAPAIPPPVETPPPSAEDEANKDPLTHLYNRRFFMQRGTQEISFAKRHNSPLSLIKLDIDNFKTIFETYGDQVADKILTKLAALLLAKIRQEDTAGRLGGTEFAVLLPSAQQVEAAVLAERLSAAVGAEILEHEGARIPLTISAGVVAWDDAMETIEKFLIQAEKHLRMAKGAGGNRVHSHTAKQPTQLNNTGFANDTTSPKQTKEARPMPAPAAEPTIDAALQMLANGDIAKLESHLPALTLRILPLLDLCNRKLGLGLSFAIESLKEKLTEYTNSLN